MKSNWFAKGVVAFMLAGIAALIFAGCESMRDSGSGGASVRHEHGTAGKEHKNISE